MARTTGYTATVVARLLAGRGVRHYMVEIGGEVYARGHRQDGSVDLDWPALCRPRQTLVIYMSHYTTGPICRGLVAGGLEPGLYLERS